jgi:hypothetical protein
MEKPRTQLVEDEEEGDSVPGLPWLPLLFVHLSFLLE